MSFEEDEKIKFNDKQNYIVFPEIDRIPSNKIFDAYSKLYEAYNKLYKEKEIAVNSLKNEILNNDQQRNYIEILKQTIESSLIQSGLKEKILDENNNNKEEENRENNNENFINNVIKITSLNNNLEQLKGVNTSLEIEKVKLKNEILKINEENGKFKEKILNSLESGIKDLEEAKIKIKNLETEKDNLIKELDESNEYNEKLMETLKKFEQDNDETSEGIKMLKINFENQIKNNVDKYTKIKEDNEKLKTLNNELIKNSEAYKENKKILNEQNDKIKSENIDLKTELNKIKVDFSNSLQSNAKLNNDYQNLLKLNNELQKQIRLNGEEKQQILNEQNRLNQILVQRNSELYVLQDQFNEVQTKLNSLNNNQSTNTTFTIDNNTNSNSISSPQKNILNNNNNTFNNDFKMCIYNCLNVCHEFLNNYRELSQQNKYFDFNNKLIIKLVNIINKISVKFEECYQNLNCNTNSRINYQNEIERLYNEIKSYKSDNKKLYERNKQLIDENAKLFYINKENKFYFKFISRIIKHHISNYDIKNILHQIILVNDKAIGLEIDKNRIETKLETLMKDSSSNINEINKSKKFIKDIENEINDKFIQLKLLDNQLKEFEQIITNNDIKY